MRDPVEYKRLQLLTRAIAATERVEKVIDDVRKFKNTLMVGSDQRTATEDRLIELELKLLVAIGSATAPAPVYPEPKAE